MDGADTTTGSSSALVAQTQKMNNFNLGGDLELWANAAGSRRKHNAKRENTTKYTKKHARLRRCSNKGDS